MNQKKSEQSIFVSFLMRNVASVFCVGDFVYDNFDGRKLCVWMDLIDELWFLVSAWFGFSGRSGRK